METIHLSWFNCLSFQCTCAEPGDHLDVGAEKHLDWTEAERCVFSLAPESLKPHNMQAVFKHQTLYLTGKPTQIRNNLVLKSFSDD